MPGTRPSRREEQDELVLFPEETGAWLLLHRGDLGKTVCRDCVFPLTDLHIGYHQDPWLHLATRLPG